MFDEYHYGYYQSLRTAARSRIVSALNKKIKTLDDRERWRGITLASIDHEACEYARLEWPKYYGDSSHNGLPSSWERLSHSYHNKAAHFNIAVWQTIGETKTLQGLALGKPSGGKSHLTINWVERSYAPTYFRGGVLLPILACAEVYAKLLGCQRVLIKDPIDVSPFTKYGFGPYNMEASKGAIYLSKEI